MGAGGVGPCVAHGERERGRSGGRGGFFHSTPVSPSFNLNEQEPSDRRQGPGSR